eukprot:TRINITY_DN23788_c0_g1_i1.p1 TRINITY_DN23788_c0_g1~~TRINITY_DN23788_c0_g1_i1.p1  ORF type:complete len:887 (-),score=124.38 TRINITY_DN23788_c0_g1_i1:99-2375(-)
MAHNAHSGHGVHGGHHHTAHRDDHFHGEQEERSPRLRGSCGSMTHAAGSGVSTPSRHGAAVPPSSSAGPLGDKSKSQLNSMQVDSDVVPMLPRMSDGSVVNPRHSQDSHPAGNPDALHRFDSMTSMEDFASQPGDCHAMDYDGWVHSESSEYDDKVAPVINATSTSKGAFGVHDVWLESFVAAEVRDKSERGTRRTHRHVTTIGNVFLAEEDMQRALREEADGLDDDEQMQVHADTVGWFRHICLHPGCRARFAWDIASMVLVLYDMVFLPLQFFEIEDNTFFAAMIWCARLFWTFDLPMNLCTGFMMLDGTIEMRPCYIFGRYARTWMLLDFAIVISDWAEVGYDEGLGYARATKASRTLRLMRLVRLARMIKLKRIVDALFERIESEKLRILTGMFKILIIILTVSHLIACGWWGMGTRDEGITWVKDYGYDGHGFGTQYTMSVHWAISMFTGGMDEVTPKNVYERTFAIFVFLFCFVLAAVFLSSLTSSMTRLHLLTSGHSRQIRQLRDFLCQNGISKGTKMRILRNAHNALSSKMHMMLEGEVELLAVISQPLRYELHFELYSHMFDTHWFFHKYSEECPVVMRKVCHYASSLCILSRGDVVFSLGEIPAHPRTYVTSSGRLRYVDVNARFEEVGPDQWIGEMSLWTKWAHRGSLTAASDCRFYRLDARKFMDITGQFEHQGFDPTIYAKAFVQDMNTLGNQLADLYFHSNSRHACPADIDSRWQVHDVMTNEYKVRIHHNFFHRHHSRLSSTW